MSGIVYYSFPSHTGLYNIVSVRVERNIQNLLKHPSISTMLDYISTESGLFYW